MLKLVDGIYQTDCMLGNSILGELRQEIIKRSDLIPSHPSHNQGGWRSDEDVLTWQIDGVDQLRGAFAALIREAESNNSNKQNAPYDYYAWALVNRSKSYHNRHVHAGAVWSGVYYLDNTTAATVFELSETGNDTLFVYPAPGRLVIFPSLTWHGVESCPEDEVRVTIAFDARVRLRNSF